MEVAAFEAQLEDNLSAQSALVAAVQIVGLLQSTPTCETLSAAAPAAQPRTVTRGSVIPRRSPDWTLATAVAGVAVAVSGFALLAPNSRPMPRGGEAPALAQAWSELDAAQITAELPDDDSVPSVSTESTSAEAVSDNDVPDWLLTAILVEEEANQVGDELGHEEETQL
ncbi:MAG: hypothetical protein DWH91_13435 [Planctomycetota bacterium]|nr:MAG: hypothetical protein DWH91_13435 [Planctomycetota bacterium]